MATHGLNGAELARRIQVEPSAVSRWLSGDNMPAGQELAALAVVLEIQAWVLLGSDFKQPLPARELPRRGRPAAPKVSSEAMRSALDRKPSDEPFDGVSLQSKRSTPKERS